MPDVQRDRRPPAPVPPDPDSSDAAAVGRPATRTTSRRTVLQLLGLGSAVVVVAGAGGLTRRAVDGGVFDTGRGAAYAAWGEAVPDGQPLSLVRAAVLAANAHNAQPWIFVVIDDRIEVFADLTRTLGTMDPLLRELHISLGCALENLVQAGPPNGLHTTVTLMPDTADPAHVATVSLRATGASSSLLFDAIEHRHTDRNAYDAAPVDQAQLDELAGLVDTQDAALLWLTTDADRQSFADLTVRATQAIIDDDQMSADDFRWYRSSWSDLQRDKDGITIDPSGQSPLIRAVSKLLPVSQQQSNDGWLTGTRDTQLPTASAFGALVLTRPTDPVQRLQVGRIWQRVHLTATGLGLSLQPLCQIPERIDREASAGLAPDITAAASTLFPAGRHPVMTFRIGHPSTDALSSPRRPAEDVVRASGGIS